MLNVWGRPRTLCDGVSRRDFLRIGAFGGLFGLADILRLHASTRVLGGTSQKAAIMVYLNGGPSHLDLFDLKPHAPLEYRGEFRAIHTTIPGIEIGELLPRLAAGMEHLSLIRSITGAVEEHSDAQVMSGWSERENRNVGRPSLGAIVSRLRSSRDQAMPPFVSLRGLTAGLEPGYLGPAHRAFTPSGEGMANLKLLPSVTLDRLEDRKALLGTFDQNRRALDAPAAAAGPDAFAKRALEMITSGAVRKALDLKNEDPRVRDRYGRATQFLTARRLVEAGVGCVTLSVGQWDTHAANFRVLRQLGPQLDAAVATLVEDLYERGLDKDVIVVVWGEFGRTPRINQNAGRDHWPAVMSCLLAGGGLRMGQVIGSSTARGEEAKERPYSVQNVLATVYHALGIDPAMTFNDRSGRPRHVLEDRELIRELV